MPFQSPKGFWLQRLTASPTAHFPAAWFMVEGCGSPTSRCTPCVAAPALHLLLHTESKTRGESGPGTDHWGYEDAKAASCISPPVPGPIDLHRYILRTPTPTPRKDFASGNLDSCLMPAHSERVLCPWDPLSTLTAMALGSHGLLRVNIPPWGSKMTKIQSSKPWSTPVQSPTPLPRLQRRGMERTARDPSVLAFLSIQLSQVQY